MLIANPLNMRLKGGEGKHEGDNNSDQEHYYHLGMAPATAIMSNKMVVMVVGIHPPRSSYLLSSLSRLVHSC